jgi:hypothetical protein
MAEHDDRAIVTALKHRSDRGEARGADAVVAAAWRQHDRTDVGDPRFRRRRARGVWMATAAAVVVVMVLLARALPESAPDPQVPGTTPVTTTLAWQPVGSLPIPLRSTYSHAPSVWTGTEVVLVGALTHPGPDGSHQMAESAAFDPATGRTRVIAEPPVALQDQMLGAVWTGHEILVVAPEWQPMGDRSFRPPRALAYDPERNSWRTLGEAPPLIGMVWAGDRVIGWTKTVMVEFDPATDRWTEHGPSFAALDPADDTRYWGPVAWSRGRLASFGREVAVFTPGTDRMERIDLKPPFGTLFAAASDDTLMVYGQAAGGQQVATYDLATSTGIVSTLGPANSVAMPPTIAFVNGRLMTWDDHQDSPRDNVNGGTMYDPATDRWSLVPRVPGDPISVFSGVGLGDRLIVWAREPFTGGQPSLIVYAMTVN